MNLDIPPIAPRSCKLDPGKTVIIIVDMENDFCRKEGTMYVGSRVNDVLLSIKRLIERARPLRIPIVYVQSIRNAESPEIAVYRLKPYVMKGTWGAEIAEEIKPIAKDYVVTKHTHDCFYETKMDSLLKKLGINPFTHNVIVCGVNTATCVYHAVLGFHIRHYNVYVPMDCTTSRGETAGIIALSLLNRPAYDFNVSLTNSDVISFLKPGVVKERHLISKQTHR